MDQRERDICARLREFRKAIRWSQPAFSRRLGITLDQLKSIEYARTPLRYDVAWKIRTVFGLSIDWLWGGDMGPGDLDEDRALPPPEATKLPANALVTQVFEKVHGAGVNEVFARAAKGGTRRPRMINEEISHRAFHLFAIKLRLREWIARLPDGYTADFHDKIAQLASVYLKAAPAEPTADWEERYDALVWEEMRRDISKRTSVQDLGRESELDTITAPGNFSGVKLTLAALLKRLNKATEQHGMKSKLAKYMGVPLPNVSQWLSGEREPSGETTLRLLYWVEQQERKT